MGKPPPPSRGAPDLDVSSNKISRTTAIKPWAFEVVVLVLALGAFAAIVVVLWIYNGEESPAWQYSINLNSLVAILSTVLRAALMVPVAECTSLYPLCFAV